MGRVRIAVNQEAISAVLRAESYKASRTGARTIRARVRSNITASGRINTGAMLRSIQVKGIGQSRWRIYSALPYTRYQENGTRAHGPRTAKMLRFKPKGSNGFVFAKWVRGVTPAHFFKNALDSATINDFTAT